MTTREMKEAARVARPLKLASGGSSIEWTGVTWNPVVGCRRVSPGCDLCYAIFEANRKKTKVAHYAGLTIDTDDGLDWSGKFSVAPDHIFDIPLRKRKPTVFFVNSMSDLFGEGVTDETIERIFAIMLACPQHTFQILTKRPNRLVKMADRLPWPPNIWIGVSIEDGKYAARADLLRRVPAAVRFISAEPLIAGLQDVDFVGIDWVIAGGESGRSRANVRPMNGEWVRDIRDRCNQLGVAFFFKQWGNWGPDGRWHRSKKGPGRELDGRMWEEMPTPRAPGIGGSIDGFRQTLHFQCIAEDYEQIQLDGKPARNVIKPYILKALADRRMNGPALRAATIELVELSPDNSRHVNSYAWGLSGLVASKAVTKSVIEVPGKRPGRTKKVVVYERAA